MPTRRSDELGRPLCRLILVLAAVSIVGCQTDRATLTTSSFLGLPVPQLLVVPEQSEPELPPE